PPGEAFAGHEHSPIVPAGAKDTGANRRGVSPPTDQAESAVRPLRRRRARTARPPRVRMRTRNPWVLLRLRVFGWNVCFIARRSWTSCEGLARVYGTGDVEKGRQEGARALASVRSPAL